MNKYIDEKLAVTLIVVSVALFFIQHWLTKKVVKDGKTSLYIGNDDLGYIGKL